MCNHGLHPEIACWSEVDLQTGRARRTWGVVLGPGCAGRGEWAVIRWGFAFISMHGSAWLLFLTCSCAPGQGYILFVFTLDDFLCQRFKTALYFSVCNWERLWYIILLFSHEDFLWGRHVPRPLPNQEKLFGGMGNGKAGWTSNAQITSNKNTKIQVPEVRNTGGNSITLINI